MIKTKRNYLIISISIKTLNYNFTTNSSHAHSSATGCERIFWKSNFTVREINRESRNIQVEWFIGFESTTSIYLFILLYKISKKMFMFNFCLCIFFSSLFLFHVLVAIKKTVLFPLLLCVCIFLCISCSKRCVASAVSARFSQSTKIGVGPKAILRKCNGRPQQTSTEIR